METSSNAPRVPVVTVSQVNRVAEMLINGDKRLANVAVRGEISNFKNHYMSGHLYFTLKDGASQLSCMMWADKAAGLGFDPENGDKVVCRGAVRVYAKNGVYQLYCSEMKRDGEGEQAAALEELKKRLYDEGIFSRKRQLPAMPRRIAVITAPDSAAVRDIITVIGRRYPIATLVVIPALVQGEGAPQSVAHSLERAQRVGADVIIFGRGGGSSEDLGAFNTELVARAVFASSVPTISAVGHETDTTIADMAADMRAPTPSAAAELAVPEIGSIYSAVDGMGRRARAAVMKKLSSEERMLSARAELIRALSPQSRINAMAQRLDSVCAMIKRQVHGRLDASERQVLANADMISALNPLGVLSRGYSVAKAGGRVVSDAAQLSVGDRIELTFGKGGAAAEITEIKKD